MNNKRRELLKQSIQMLEKAFDYVSQALDEEQDCLGGIPENLQASEAYEKMEAAIDNLESAIDSIDSAKESIEVASE